MTRHLKALGWAGLQLLCPFVHVRPCSRICGRPSVNQIRGNVPGLLAGHMGENMGQTTCQPLVRPPVPTDVQKLKPLHCLGNLKSLSKGFSLRRRKAWIGYSTNSQLCYFPTLEPWLNNLNFQASVNKLNKLNNTSVSSRHLVNGLGRKTHSTHGTDELWGTEKQLGKHRQGESVRGAG